MQETGVQILFTFTDLLSGGEMVDQLVHNAMAVANAEVVSSMTVEGDGGLVTFTFVLRVQCVPFFFGPDCNTFCVGENDSSGRFECDPTTGAIVCLTGYQNPASNCTDCAPAEGCCKSPKKLLFSFSTSDCQIFCR